MKNFYRKLCIVVVCLLVTIMPIKVNANSITFHKSKTTLGVGYSENLKYNLSEGLSIDDIVWTSTNTNVATVENGKIIAIAEGETIITASVGDNKTTCKVTVVPNYIPITGLTLNKNSTTLLVGETDTLSLTINPSDATNKNITWTSSNPSVASVNSSGKITALSAGTTTIIASSSTLEARCEVTVTYSLSLTSISINKTNITIKEKATEQLGIIYSPNNATNKKVTWKSSNTSVATVDSSGNVNGISPGTATITAVSNDGGYVATCKVTVEEISKKVESISLDKNELSLKIDETAELKVTITPDYAENKNIVWTSSDESIAKVENGVVTGISPGTVEIKATSEDGNKEAICKVTITSPPVEEISFDEEEKTVFLGSEVVLVPTTIPEHSAIENPIWTSSDESVAMVEKGRIKALSLGETTITISNQDNTLTASIIIKVVAPPKEPLQIDVEGYKLNFNPNVKNYTLTIGDETKLTITTNKDNKNVTIKGNQNLKSGSIITITINDEESITYIINIKKKTNYTIYFIAIISVLLLINLIRIMIKNKKKKKY